MGRFQKWIACFSECCGFEISWKRKIPAVDENMVFLVTDTGEYREAQVPSVVTIGRGEGNSLKPNNGSASSNHASISFQYIDGTNKVEAWIEEIKARYGTFVGPNPLELEKLTGRVKLKFGDYMRFGHATKFFRYVESIPKDADIAPPELIVSPSKPLSMELKNPANYGSQNQPQFPTLPTKILGNDFNDSGRGLNTTASSMRGNGGTAGQYENKLVASSGGNSLEVMSTNNNINNTALALPSSKPLPTPEPFPVRPLSGPGRGQQQQQSDSQNMNISIQYPTASQQQHPISITIDSSMGNSPQRQSRNDPGRYASNYDNDDRNINFMGSHGERGLGGETATLRASSPAKLYSSDRVNFMESDNQYGAGTFNDVSNLPNQNMGDNMSYSNTQQQNQTYRSGASGAYGNSGRYGSAAPRLNNNVAFDEPPPVYAASRSTAHRGPQSPPRKPNPAWQPDSLMRSSQGNYAYEDLAYAAAGYSASSGKPQPPKLNPRNHFAPREDKEQYYQQQQQQQQAQAAQPKTRQRKETNITRRSWPDGLSPPTSFALSKFVDMLLDQDIGVTWEHFMMPAPGNANGSRKRAKDAKASKSGQPEPPDPENVRRSQVAGNVLPKVLPEFVLSEAIAESMIENGSTANTMISAVITDLNDLLRQALLGSNMTATDLVGTSADFDYALESVLCNIIKSSAKVLNDVGQLGILLALEGVPSREIRYERSVPYYVRNAAESLIRTNAFMMGTYLKDEASALRPEHKYEIVALTLSNILDKLDACNLAIWSIGQKVDNAAMEHASAKSGLFKGNLSMELEELRKLKKEQDLTPVIEKIRMQESARAEEKYLKCHRFCEIVFGYQLKSCFQKMKLQMKLRRRQQLLVGEFTGRRDVTLKKKVYAKLVSDWKIARMKKVTLYRFERVVGPKLLSKTMRYFRKWQDLVRNPNILSAEAANQIAGLKGTILDLKANIHELSKKSELAANLAAERCFNRELSATNLELRHSVQKLELKLLDMSDVPASKRKDLVYHFLINKEDEIVDANRELRFLKNELEQLSDLNAVFASNVMNRRLPDNGHTPAPSANSPPAHYNPHKGSLQAPRVPMRAPVPGPAMYMRGNANEMTKQEATQVVYNELRRLKDSIVHNEKEREKMQEKMVGETTKNVQNTLAIQGLQSRLTKLERSCSALRELLKQRVGEGGVLELIEALDSVGAGGSALMETPLLGGEGSTPSQSPHGSVNGGFGDDAKNAAAAGRYGRSSEPRDTSSFPTSKFSREIDNAMYR